MKARKARWPFVMRLIGGLLLLLIAGIHLNLYSREEYDKIPTVGVLFLLTAISAVVLAIAFLVRPWRLVEASSGLFALSVLGGYLLTLLLPDGLFGFKEPGISYSGVVSIAAEALTFFVSVVLLTRRDSARRGDTPVATSR